LDLVQGGIAVTPTENVGEGVQAAVSDLLGNHVYFFQVGNTAASTSTGHAPGASLSDKIERWKR
jgi:hypothetical protein